MSRLHGVDVSRYQPDWTPDPLRDSFVFVKATEGRTVLNPIYAKQINLTRIAGMVVGHYHYMHRGNAKEQAAYFVKNVDLRPGELLVCDWEGDWQAGKHPSVADAAEFISEVKRLAPGHRCLLYCNRSDWMNTNVKAPDGLWIARYGTSDPNVDPFVWDFWQYTDKPMDLNWSRFETMAELKEWAGYPAEPTPPPSNTGHWMVNPAKVSTRLWGRDPDGDRVSPLEPGTIITDGVRFDFNWAGRIALWTAKGVAYEREYLTQVAAGPVPVPVTPTRPLPVIPAYEGTERLRFRGGRTCICVATSLPWVEYRMLEAGIIRFNIDIYQLGYRDDVKQSMGTHAEGGNTDNGQYSEAALRIWREMGWAMQDRSPFFADDHGHGWPVGCPHLSPSAEKQEVQWNDGLNGLKNPGRITGPNPKGPLTRRWDLALADYKDLLDLEVQA
jgi:hypothetical protein